MAERKKDKGKRKAPKQRRRQPPRKIPRILQTRMMKTEDGQEEVTLGDLVVMAIKVGAFRAEAARAAGISRTSIFNWAQRGEDAIALAQEQQADPDEDVEVTADDVPEKDRPYVDFVNALLEAEASSEVFHIRNIRRHSEKDWRASAWILARKWPERWGSREHPDSTGGYTLADIERLMDEAVEAAEQG